MSLSNGQKRALHAAARAAKLNDDQRRMIQKGIGGHLSAADAGWTRHEFISVMAHLERQYCRDQIPGYTPKYWQTELRKSSPASSLAYACRCVAGELGWSDAELDAFLAGPRMSGGKCLRVADAPVYWLSRLLGALKAIRNRRDGPVVTTAATEAAEKCSLTGEVPF